MKKIAVIISGYFNPIHKRHLEYMNNAKSLGDYLIVIVNSDLQRKLKGLKEFQKEDERMIIVSNIKAVDDVFLSLNENCSVCKKIEKIYKQYSNEFKLSNVNGGNQNKDTIHESVICEKLGIDLIDGLGNKIQSSSWLIK